MKKAIFIYSVGLQNMALQHATKDLLVEKQLKRVNGRSV